MEPYSPANPFWGWTEIFFIGSAQAAAPESGLDGWVLGDYLLVGFLVLVVLGWLSGAYALLFSNLFSNVGPRMKRVFLYPLLKVMGKSGDKKPWTSEKRKKVEDRMETQAALDFQIGLEERIGRIYGKIASEFSSSPDHDEGRIAFWEQLARDEAVHASLLSIEKEFLQNGIRIRKPVQIELHTQEALEILLSECEGRIGPGITENEVIEILVSLEASEVNKIFSSLLEATDSKVLTRFASFSSAHKDHEWRVLEGVKKMEVRDAQTPSPETA